MTDLEQKLVKDVKAGKKVSLERALLIISGLKSKKDIEKYAQVLDQIHNGFTEKLKSRSPISSSALRKYTAGTRARLLFEYLWNSKPRRCNSNFLLADVIDAQISPDINQKVGSCIGLTSLYTVLGLREGLDLTISVSDSHIVNRLRVDEIIYDIDNTDPLGFDCNLEGKYYVEYPAINLVANVINSRGMARERAGDLERAEEDYNKAIKINPTYPNAHNNRGNIKLRNTDYTGAVRDYDRAIELYSQFGEAYYNRGITKENLGDLNGAVQDFSKAIEINPEDVDAYWRRGIAKENLGDYSGAIEDLDEVTKLDPESEARIVKLRQRVERRQRDMGA